MNVVSQESTLAKTAATDKAHLCQVAKKALCESSELPTMLDQDVAIFFEWT